MGITAHRYARANLGADLGEIVRSHGRTFRPQLNDCGSGSFLLQNDDSQWSSIARGNVVKFRIDGVPRFAMLVEGRRKASISREEEFGQATEFHGRGTLAVLEEAVVWPERSDAVGDTAIAPNTDARVFNFSSTYFSDLGWGNAVATDYGGEYGSEPTGWPSDSPGQHIWDRELNRVSEPVQIYAPAGDVYFRKSFTVSGVTRVRIYMAADDLYELWVDNALVLTETRWYAGQSRNVELTLASGTHLLAVKGTNVNALKAWIRVAVYSLDGNNEPHTLLVSSDETWKALGYPAAAPGFTPGQILDILVDEAKARNSITDVTLGFDHLNDSDGAAWTTTADVAIRFGMSYLDVVRQLAETYIDVAMDIDVLRLEAWITGTRGGASGVMLNETTITSLEYEGEG